MQLRIAFIFIINMVLVKSQNETDTVLVSTEPMHEDTSIEGSGLKPLTIFLIVIGCVIIFAAILAFYFIRRRRRTGNFSLVAAQYN
ncbi:unnamed protein product [Trichobilharzia szidati]|nr:unnamed protein product [Trichobilharzia szidati]